MKKIFAAAFIVLLFACTHTKPKKSAEFSEKPAFGKSNAFVFSNDIGAEDYIRALNYSSYSNFTLHFWFYDETQKEWLSAGEAFLKGSGDTDIVKNCPIKDRLGKYFWYAVEYPTGCKLKFNFSEQWHDLYVSVCDESEDGHLSASNGNFISDADKLIKLKELLDKGVISEREFQEAKKKFLGSL